VIIDAVLKTKSKLLQFLDESTFYKAERILSRLPVDSKRALPHFVYFARFLLLESIVEVPNRLLSSFWNRLLRRKSNLVEPYRTARPGAEYLCSQAP